MSKKSRERGERRRDAAAERRAAIAAQFKLPSHVMTPSTPNHLGRAMFLSRKEMRKYVSSGGKLPKPEYLQPTLAQETEAEIVSRTNDKENT